MDLRILVSRADRIGDLVLTLPAIGWLKRCTGAHVTLHCSAYAKDIGLWAKHNGVLDDLLFQDSEGQWNQPRASYAGLLSFFHTPSVRELLKHVSVPRSFGPRTKLAALWTYSRSLAQHRSRVEKSEMHYNLDLARRAMELWGYRAEEFRALPKLEVPAAWLEGYAKPRGLVVSLSNGGSAQNWQSSDYFRWVEENAPDQPVDFLVAGLDAAVRKAELLRWRGYDEAKHRVVESLPSVAHLVGYLSQAERLVASSTGPLHIAHAAGVDVLGIYPTKRVESFKRWRPDGYRHGAELKWIEIGQGQV
jgi:ADP-heptose:LPS heptosyltransferase